MSIGPFDIRQIDRHDLAQVTAAVRRREAEEPADDPPLTVTVLRNYTCEPLAPYLKFHCYRSGLRPRLALGGYDTYTQELLAGGDPAEIRVLTLMLETLDGAYGLPGWQPGGVIARLEELCGLAARTEGLLAVNTFLPPVRSETGFRLPPDGSDLTGRVQAVNAWMRDYVRAHGDRCCLLDWERYLRALGEPALDPRSWYAFHQPFRPAFYDLMAADLAAVGRALKGKTKKCLVLDCDNTLWGGIVGEDGLAGLRLDPYAYPGNLYYQFQRSVLQLVAQGVMVALCSKNEEADVWEVLETHPHCLLRREHLVGWRINWQDKATNLAELAAELNIGLEHVVFVDDSPLECACVREALPAVTVLPVPEPLTALPRLLFEDGWFAALNVSEEDRRRPQLYRAEARRQLAAASFPDLAAFLASLEIALEIAPLAAEDVARAAQLTQRTNQFNLTTRRYAEPELRALLDRPDARAFTLRVADRFGDYGLTGLLIARREGEAGVIDTLLLSCRVLGRDVERRLVADCLQRLTGEWGVRHWAAEYRPTRKNGQVRDFWAAQGFTLIEETEAGRRYRYEVPAQG